jgi:hypothetical protein
VQIADSYRLDALNFDPLYRAPDVRLIERGDHSPTGIDPLFDLEAVIARGERRRANAKRAVKSGHAHALDLQNVAEPFGSQEGGLRALPFENGIRCYSTAM